MSAPFERTAGSSPRSSVEYWARLAGLIAWAALGCSDVPIGTDHSDGAVLETGAPADANAGGGADGAATDAPTTPTGCIRDTDCAPLQDYCLAQCGVCRAAAAGEISKCLAPPNVKCSNPCASHHTACQSGVCTLL